MSQTLTPFSPEQWMANVLSSSSFQNGQMIRRKLTHIDQIIGREKFLLEIARRGWHAVENADQMIIFCNPEPIRVIL